MTNAFSILIESLKDLLRPRILAVMIVPFLGSFAIWFIITMLMWDWIMGLGIQFYSWTLVQKLVEMLSPLFVITEDPISSVIVAAFILVVILPAALITAMFITSLLLVPIMVKDLRQREYPQLKAHTNSIFTGVGTSLLYSFKYFVAWIVTLPLWLIIPGGAVIIPYLLISWLNSRLFPWEIMVEIADGKEIQPFVSRNSKPLLGWGLITGLIYYVPIVNLIAPVITTAVFARYCLQQYSTRCQAVFPDAPSHNGQK